MRTERKNKSPKNEMRELLTAGVGNEDTGIVGDFVKIVTMLLMFARVLVMLVKVFLMVTKQTIKQDDISKWQQYKMKDRAKLKYETQKML